MTKLLFIISQLYKGGAETALVNLLNRLDHNKYKADLLIFDQHPIAQAVPLNGSIHKKVNVCDAYAEIRRNPFKRVINKIRKKFMYSRSQLLYHAPAIEFTRGKRYDMAFFIGEWRTPAFLTEHVDAGVKAAWIHNDLSKADYFDAGEYFRHHDYIDYYIFVSENSMLESVRAYPFLKDKSLVLHNMLDTAQIREMGAEPPDDEAYDGKLPVVVTCANIRPQKNHLRQVKVMAELKRRGLDFIWLNIGSFADRNLVNRIKLSAAHNGLKGSFLLRGPKENPYKYMKNACAVAVLSDYESWSLVITEARILGIPVIATRTSGAKEQIENGKTGILTGFSEDDIAEKMELLLKDTALQKRIRGNLRDFDDTEHILQAFDNFVTEALNVKKTGSKSAVGGILYVIDDVNYVGGAHIATILQIKEFLKQGRDVTIFSTNTPSVSLRKEVPGVKFLPISEVPVSKVYHRRLLSVLSDLRVPVKHKLLKIAAFLLSRTKYRHRAYDKLVTPEVTGFLAPYDTICVMSEGSAYREAVSKIKDRRKIQWIHTDYCAWKDVDEWRRMITANDGELYRNFDTIVVLTEGIKESFTDLYPHLAEKVAVNRNLIAVENITARARVKRYPKQYILEQNTPEGVKKPMRFVTVGRVDHHKAVDRLIRVMLRLRARGYDFRWFFVGGGEGLEKYRDEALKCGLGDVVEFTGEVANPFPYVKNADVFALLSNFEGLPNTVYEALILGTPVLATDVGGIHTQVTEGETGWLADNDFNSIYLKLVWLLRHPEAVSEVRDKIQNYSYDNLCVMRENDKIFFRKPE